MAYSDKEEKMEFRYNVKRVDIENYNVCNRLCVTCPQSLGIRGGKIQLFSEYLFLKLMNELKECDYSETIAIGRYHEPLLISDLTIKRISLVKKLVPKARLIMNTNGDFISRELLAMLSASGLDELKIMRYQDSGYNTDKGVDLCKKMSEQLGKGIVSYNIVDMRSCYMQLEKEDNMAISVRSENYYSECGNSRGGLIKDLNIAYRNRPCYVPKHSIDIDYNGYVLPCCNLISDAVEHKPYIIGNINNETIYSIYYRALQSHFFESIQKASFSDYQICQFCTYDF